MVRVINPFFKYFHILVIYTVFCFVLSAPVWAQVGTAVASGQTVRVDAHGECRQVTNPSAGTRMVFTGTAPEWQSFINNPSGLEMDVCILGLYWWRVVEGNDACMKSCTGKNYAFRSLLCVSPEPGMQSTGDPMENCSSCGGQCIRAVSSDHDMGYCGPKIYEEDCEITQHSWQFQGLCDSYVGGAHHSYDSGAQGCKLSDFTPPLQPCPSGVTHERGEEYLSCVYQAQWDGGSDADLSHCLLQPATCNASSEGQYCYVRDSTVPYDNVAPDGDVFAYFKCNAPKELADCTTPWGASVAHGASITAYQASSVPHGNSCVSQARTCLDGTLSGSYTHQNCTVDAPPAGGTLKFDGQLACINNANPPSGYSPCPASYPAAEGAACSPIGAVCAAQAGGPGHISCPIGSGAVPWVRYKCQ